MTTVLIGSPSARTDAIRARLRAQGWDVQEADLGTHTGEDELIAALRGVDAVIARGEPYTARVLAAADRLRVIARTGVGYDTIDVDAATARGVVVTTAIGSNDRSVADFTVMLMLALARRLLEAHDALARRGEWDRLVGLELSGRKVGVVGTGAIGRQVTRRLRAFDCPVLGYDAAPDPAFAAESGLTYVDLDRLLGDSDVVTLHVPLLPGTLHLVGKRELALMKPTAFLVNTARGGVVDETALAQALAERRLAGAALDVFPREPLPPDSPLRTLDSVILTPHLAGVTRESMARAGAIAAENVVRVLRGDPPLSCVNPAALRRG